MNALEIALMLIAAAFLLAAMLFAVIIGTYEQRAYARDRHLGYCPRDWRELEQDELEQVFGGRVINWPFKRLEDMTPEEVANIKPGDTVRIRAGTVISLNDRRRARDPKTGRFMKALPH